MHILVVDDDVRLARQISSAVTEAGHDPVVIHNGEEALDAAAENSLRSDCARYRVAANGWL